MWYPLFEPENKFKLDYKFSAKSYKELIEQYDLLFNKEAKKKEGRILDTANYFKELYLIDEVHIDDFKINPQYYLKYSKSQLKWTIYRFEFYIVKAAPGLDLSIQTRIIQDLLPMNTDFNNYKGLPVVENLVKILENKEVAKEIEKCKKEA
jgi:hypothetical protein